MHNQFTFCSVKDLQGDYDRIAILTQEAPVVITVNNRHDTVLMAYKDFIKQQQHISELENRLALWEQLIRAMNDVNQGRTQDANAVFSDILAELEQSSSENQL